MTEPTDDEIAALRSEFGITSNGRGIKEFTQVRDFARAVLAKWGTPAGSGEVVAHRVMRKSLSGEWASDAWDWSDGPPSRALVDSICADKGRWRIDVAYAAPAAVGVEPYGYIYTAQAATGMAPQTLFTHTKPPCKALPLYTRPAAPADSVLEDAARESEYRRGYRHGYEQRDAEVRGALV